jgi:hypothetical protein
LQININVCINIRLGNSNSYRVKYVAFVCGKYPACIYVSTTGYCV